MKRKLILVATAIVLAVAPLYAVLSEKNLSETLSVLRNELRAAFLDMAEMKSRFQGKGDIQHGNLVRMMQRSNELSLMLYSQKQDYTFDMTYALNEVSKNYNEFASRKLPFDDIITRLDIDIERYDRLAHALRSLPPSTSMEYLDSAGNVVVLSPGAPVPPRIRPDGRRPERPFELDSLGRIDRDSCLFYAEALLAASLEQKERLVRDSTHYSETAQMLKSAYDYAQDRYKTVQNKIFIDGQTSYDKILAHFNRYWSQASREAAQKYDFSATEGVHSQWRGPIVIGFSLFALSFLVLSVVLGFLLMLLLTRTVPFFKKKRFVQHKTSMSTILAMLIFSVTILIGSAVSTHYFYSMASRLLVQFAWMLAAILVSLIIRLDSTKKEDPKLIRRGVHLYTPVLLMSFIVILLRIIFIPNNLLNIIFPPLLVLFTIFQAAAVLRTRKGLPLWDVVFGWISLAVMLGSSVVAVRGLVLLGVQLLIWWIFQLTLLQTVIALYDLVMMYYDRHIVKMKKRYREAHADMPGKTDEDMIPVTWLYSMFKKALIPIAFILSVPLSLKMASGVFDLTGIFKESYAYPFLNVEGYISLSFSKIITVLVLYFVFRYINYAAKAYYRFFKIRSLLRKSGLRKYHENQVNFTLAENVIAISLWGIYILTLFIILRIPTAAVKVVAAGLATGLGFAMKDVLNNFFYGVQLMSGRLRVGDYIECDGIRGKVDSITYQTTQIISSDGAVMAFPNASLFNKNFKNLTRNHSYEMLTFDVGVKYGSDVEQVRQIITEALQPLLVKDVYGREVVEPKFGIQVRFKDFGDNSINLTVIQYTTVEEHYTYAARAKELIYNALNAHGIEIPFPQRDLYIKKMPES